MSTNKKIVPPIVILKKMLQLTDGKDKSLKLIQYFVKILLYKYITKTKNPNLHPRLSNLASNFSTSRKILRLGHWVDPVNDFLELPLKPSTFLPLSLFNTTSQQPLHQRILDYLNNINVVIGILNDLCDDVYAFAKIGVIKSANIKQKSEIWSSKLWMASICIDLMNGWLSLKKALGSYEISKKNEAEKSKQLDMKEKAKMSMVSFTKLLFDFGFCYCDLVPLKSGDGIQAFTGFGSAMLGSYKVWVKCR
ncbi:peroxisomal biogenesis factor 11 [Paraphysoderma sedebokerense]|nr:peroxisomal biogenesis factor 11 [Paraphysoderma sedebokerense]